MGLFSVKLNDENYISKNETFLEFVTYISERQNYNQIGSYNMSVCGGTHESKRTRKYVCAYGKDLYSFCLSMTKNTYDAQDLYQETFVKFYDVADRKKTFSNVKSLLMSIAVNQYRNQKRKFVIRQNILGKPVALEENEDSISYGHKRRRYVYSSCFLKKGYGKTV